MPIPGLETLGGGALYGTPTAQAIGTWEVHATLYDQCEPEAQVVNQTYMLTITE